MKMFDGTSLKLLKTIEYGDDADNLRYDSSRHRVYVGYGDGALAWLTHPGTTRFSPLTIISPAAMPSLNQFERACPIDDAVRVLRAERTQKFTHSECFRLVDYAWAIPVAGVALD